VRAAFICLVSGIVFVSGACKPGPADLVGAVARGEPAEVEKLLARGADPNATGAIDPSGSRPLATAVTTKNLRLLEVLLAHGADPNLANPGMGGGTGYTPLGLAAFNGQADATKLLLRAGARVESGESQETPLALAAQAGDLATVDALLAAGAKVDPAEEAVGYPPLVLAAEYGNLAVVRRLVEAGAVIDRRDNLGMTALLFASAKGQLEIARYLLAKGANPLAVNRAGFTPAFAARWNDQREIVALFEKAGVTDWEMKVPPKDPPSGMGTIRVPVIEVQGQGSTGATR
jgi:uncharacterized protein